MPSKTTDTTMRQGVVGTLSNWVDRNVVAMTALGVVAGYSIAAVGTETVALPVVGEVSGLVVGSLGLLASGVAYTQLDCCGNCGRKACGCSGDCGDSCSVDA